MHRNYNAASCSGVCSSLEVGSFHAKICSKYSQNEIFGTILEFILFRDYMITVFLQKMNQRFFVQKNEAFISCQKMMSYDTWENFVLSK